MTEESEKFNLSKRCKIKIDNGMMLITMPDGTIIPGQTNVSINQDIDFANVGLAYVSVDFIISTK